MPGRLDWPRWLTPRKAVTSTRLTTSPKLGNAGGRPRFSEIRPGYLGDSYIGGIVGRRKLGSLPRLCPWLLPRSPVVIEVYAHNCGEHPEARGERHQRNRASRGIVAGILRPICGHGSWGGRLGGLRDLVRPSLRQENGQPSLPGSAWPHCGRPSRKRRAISSPFRRRRSRSRRIMFLGCRARGIRRINAICFLFCR